MLFALRAPIEFDDGAPQILTRIGQLLATALGLLLAWSQEIRRRVEALEARSGKTVPWSEVRERLFRGFE